MEKIFLLANLSYEFSEADKDYRGLVGATRHTESGERIQNLYKPSTQEYSLASDHFKRAPAILMCLDELLDNKR